MGKVESGGHDMIGEGKMQRFGSPTSQEKLLSVIPGKLGIWKPTESGGKPE